jgi:hypothetical protein
MLVCRLGKIHTFVTFDIVLNNVQLLNKTMEDYKIYMSKSECASEQIIVIHNINKLSISICFMPEGQITHHIQSQFVTREIFVLFSSELRRIPVRIQN